MSNVEREFFVCFVFDELILNLVQAAYLKKKAGMGQQKSGKVV